MQLGPFNLSKTILALVAAATLTLGACAGNEELPTKATASADSEPLYRIGPGDGIRIFVWRNPDLSIGVTVRPDGRISVPLLEDVVASGKTATELSREIETDLAQYIQNPLVTIIVSGFRGNYSEQVRVVGQAANPQAIPYRAHMTLLDAMITVGGLKEFAAGNRATLVRRVGGEQKQFRLRISDLLKDGDISANADLLPGDIIIVPESIF